ncbi:hypothetical protein [Nitrosarchaeum sp. AC2]|uniref:hypothetical protein n=1 Tax=Nitrosarchaeum sp. AC2 TaxID=2259673 RepID=UPI0015CA6E33|nr:hypothetical protein [Nitrosarchaeum sp. AC2]QLH10265.1 hypothetical protein DSQ20_01150 [Nitrosarchaeum sp. AC2]
MTRNIIDSYVPQKVMYHYNEIEKNQNKKTDWKNKTELEIWNELCFCILSGNVLYDLAKSVIEILNKKELLNPYWINETDNALSIIQLVLETPNFEPRKKNGELRKYRYPKKEQSKLLPLLRFYILITIQLKIFYMLRILTLMLEIFLLNKFQG